MPKIDYKNVRNWLSEQDKSWLMQKIDWFSDIEKRNMIKKELKARWELNDITWSPAPNQVDKKLLLRQLVNKGIDIKNISPNVLNDAINKVSVSTPVIPNVRQNILPKLFKK